MKAPSIISIGGATFDIFVRPKEQEVMEIKTPDHQEKLLCLKYGAKVKVDEVHETFGGGATNTAVAFARMGLNAACMIKVGEVYGDRVIENLKDNNVNTKFVHKIPEEKTGFSIIINAFDGDRTVLNYPGANQLFNANDLSVQALEKVDWIFLNHLSMMSDVIPEMVLSVLKKNPAIKLAWNPGYEQLVQGISKWQELLSHTEALFMNKEEAALFSGIQPKVAHRLSPEGACAMPHPYLPTYADDVSEIMATFIKAGVKHVIITDGRKGAQAAEEGQIHFCPVVSENRVDTLGAGDAFASGFTFALIEGRDLKTALLYGTLNANSVVGHHGAQIGLLTHSQLVTAAQASNLCITGAPLQKG